MSSSLLLSNCTIFGGERPRAMKGWMLVRDGCIAAIGDGPEPAADTMRNLASHTVVPGFVDAHSHITLGAWLPFCIDVSGCTSADSLLNAIGRARVDRPNDAWLVALTADFDQWAGGPPTLAQLDESCANRPALIVDNNYHRAFVSSAGLARLQFASMASVHQGDVDMRRSLPTGLLWEGAAGAALHAALRDLAAQIKDEGLLGLLVSEAKRHLAFGITNCHDPLIPPSLQPLMEQLASRTPLRVSWSRVAEESLLGAASVAELCPSCGAGPPSGKLFMDGAHRCALCLDPGHVLKMTGAAFGKALAGDTSVLRNLMRNPAQYRKGKYYTQGLRMTEADLAKRLSAMAEHGVRAKIHAFGNHAAACACKALSTVRAPGATLEHLMFLSPGDMDAIARSGAVASMQPGFIPKFGPASMDLSLTPRQHYIPAASLAAREVPVAFSSDHPCGPLDPLHNIRAAVTRTMTNGRTADDREAVTLETAISAYTIEGHRAIHGAAGSGLVPGAPADFAIVTGDLMDPAAKVAETWINGTRVW